MNMFHFCVSWESCITTTNVCEKNQTVQIMLQMTDYRRCVCVLCLGVMTGNSFSCKSALENCNKPPPLPAKRAGARRSEFRGRKNGISEEKITPDGTPRISHQYRGIRRGWGGVRACGEGGFEEMAVPFVKSRK